MGGSNHGRIVRAVRSDAVVNSPDWGVVAHIFLSAAMGALLLFALAGSVDAATVDVMSTSYSKNGSVFTATVEARHRNLPEVSGSRWTTATASLTGNQLAKSAMRAVARGATHPALIAALAVAELYYNAETDTWESPAGEPQIGGLIYVSTSSGDSNAKACLQGSIVASASAAESRALYCHAEYLNQHYGYSPGDYAYNTGSSQGGSWNAEETRYTTSTRICSRGNCNEVQTTTWNVDDDVEVPGDVTVYTPDEAENMLAPHVTPNLMKNIGQGGHGMAPYDYGDPVGEQSGEYPDELINIIAGQHEQLLHELDPANNPAPDDPVTIDPKTSEDRIEDELTEAPPPFSDVDVDWQVEKYSTIDPYQTGLSSTAECPAATVVTVPLLGEFEIDYAPMCTLADWLRPAVLAVALLFGVFIVVRGD